MTYGDVSGRNGAFVGVANPRQQPLGADVDIDKAFHAVETAGGAAVRADWGRDWQAFASTAVVSGRTVVFVSYARGAQPLAGFRFDAATGEVTKTQ